MNITEHRENYFHISSKVECGQKPTRNQETVEEWMARGGKPTVCSVAERNYIDPTVKDVIERKKRKGK